MKEEKPYAAEGYALVGAAFEVHRELGGGLLGDLYQEALETELELRGIPFSSKPVLPAYYKGRELKKRYIPDLVIHDVIIVEANAVSALLPEHEAQLLNYMRLSHRPVGYLINFAPISQIEWRRFILSDFL